MALLPPGVAWYCTPVADSALQTWGLVALCVGHMSVALLYPCKGAPITSIAGVLWWAAGVFALTRGYGSNPRVALDCHLTWQHLYVIPFGIAW